MLFFLQIWLSIRSYFSVLNSFLICFWAMLLTQFIRFDNTSLSLLRQACSTLLVMVMRTTATVSWFPSMRRPPTNQSTVCVYRIYLPGCRRKRLDLTYSCWTCAAKGVRFFQMYLFMHQLFDVTLKLDHLLLMISFLETQMMMSLYNQDCSRWQQI